MDTILQLLLLAAGFFILTKGADFFVGGASGIAEKLRVPQLIIGLTIVAMGTSAPEAAVSISAAVKGSTDITVGNIIGSNIINILVILGVTALISAMSLAQSTVYIELPFLIGLLVLFAVLGMDGSISPPEGIFLWFLFIVYLLYLFFLAKNSPQPEEPATSQRSFLLTLLLTLAGLGLIILGSDVAVDAAVKLAQFLGLSERFIGLTIVSIGTTLPEQATSITAARNNKADIAIGNIIGSCIFNILFVIGSSSIVVTIPFTEELQLDAWIAVAAGLLLFACCLPKKRLGRGAGILLLAGYLAYFIFVVL